MFVCQNKSNIDFNSRLIRGELLLFWLFSSPWRQLYCNERLLFWARVAVRVDPWARFHLAQCWSFRLRLSVCWCLSDWAWHFWGTFFTRDFVTFFIWNRRQFGYSYLDICFIRVPFIRAAIFRLLKQITIYWIEFRVIKNFPSSSL